MHRHALRLLNAINPVIARIRRRVRVGRTLPVGRTFLSALPIEPLESRTLLSAVTLQGGNGADAFYIRSDEDHIMTRVWVNANPATDPPTHAYDRLDTSALIINASGGDDSLTLDFTNGSILRSDALTFNGGDGADSITLLGRDVTRGSYLPSGPSSGTLIAARKNHAFTGVESLTANTLFSFSLIAPNDAEDLTLDTPTTNVGRIAESAGSSNTAFAPPLHHSSQEIHPRRPLPRLRLGHRHLHRQ